MIQRNEACSQVKYYLYPPSFSAGGTLAELRAKADYLEQLGVDGVVIASDGQEWSEEEKIALWQALEVLGLTLEFENQPPTDCDELHQHCRRPNWEAIPYDCGYCKDFLTELARNGDSMLYFESPYLPRSVSEMGNDSIYHWESASMLAVLLLTLRGTPLIYQGQELGMVNPVLTLETLKASEASEWLNSEDAQRRSRAELEAKIGRFTMLNAREPLDWQTAVSEELLHWYRELISLRKHSKALQMGDFCSILPEHRRAFLFTRRYEGEEVFVIANLSGYAAEYAPALEKGSLIFHNYRGQLNFSGILRPYEVKVFRTMLDRRSR